MQESHARQTEDEQGGGSMFLRGKDRGDAGFIMVLQKMGAGANGLREQAKQVVMRLGGFSFQ